MMLWLSSLLFTGKENGKATESRGNMFHDMSTCFFKVGKRDREEWIPIIIPCKPQSDSSFKCLFHSAKADLITALTPNDCKQCLHHPQVFHELCTEGCICRALLVRSLCSLHKVLE